MVATDGETRKRGQDKQKVSIGMYLLYGKDVMSVQLLEVSLLGVATVLLSRRDVWSTVK